MDIIQLLNKELDNGFTKTDLENLIGLPKNSLSATLKGNRKISTISKLKIERWLQSEIPSVLDYAKTKGTKKSATIIFEKEKLTTNNPEIISVLSDNGSNADKIKEAEYKNSIRVEMEKMLMEEEQKIINKKNNKK